MVKVFLITAGNTQNTQAQFWQRLVRSTNAKRVEHVRDCDVTLTFCPIVSRVGTDVEAAVQLIPTTRPGVLVLLHQTFNPDEIVPDASRFVRRADILTVNCLFHESELLNSECNDQAFERVSRYLGRIASQSPHTGYELPSPHQNRNHGNHSMRMVWITVTLGLVFIIYLYLVPSLQDKHHAEEQNSTVPDQDGQFT